MGGWVISTFRRGRSLAKPEAFIVRDLVLLIAAFVAFVLLYALALMQGWYYVLEIGVWS